MSRAIRLNADIHVDSQTKKPEIVYRASTNEGSKLFTAHGRSEAEAISALKLKVTESMGLKAIKTGYPKTVEANW